MSVGLKNKPGFRMDKKAGSECRIFDYHGLKKQDSTHHHGSRTVFQGFTVPSSQQGLLACCLLAETTAATDRPTRRRDDGQSIITTAVNERHHTTRGDLHIEPCRTLCHLMDCLRCSSATCVP